MHLAQLNIAHALADMESPIMADFINNTDRINALAAGSPGFVWRHEGYEGDATEIARIFGNDRTLANMSVWESKDHLFEYVYNSGHKEIFRRKKEWFHKMPKIHAVLWFIPKGHLPTLEEANERLTHLQEHGESAYAFSFKSTFTPKDLTN